MHVYNLLIQCVYIADVVHVGGFLLILDVWTYTVHNVNVHDKSQANKKLNNKSEIDIERSRVCTWLVVYCCREPLWPTANFLPQTPKID